MKLFELLDAIKKDVQTKTGDENPEVYFTSDVHGNEVEGGNYGWVTPMFIVKLIFTPLSDKYSGLRLWMGKNYKPVIIDGNVQDYTKVLGFEDRDDIDRGKVTEVVTSLKKIFDGNYIVTWMVNPIWV